MSLTGFLYSLASVPMFASRPFLAAFLTALLARYGTSIPWLEKQEVIIALSHAPEWFRGFGSLAILCALAVTEALAVKHAEVRSFMEDFDGYLKSAIAVVVSLALIDKETSETIKAIQRDSLGFESAGSVLVGALVFGVSAMRRGVLGYVSELDDDDDIGLQSLLNWVENSWTVLGIFFLVIFPLVALVLSALTALGLYVARRRIERREQLSKIPCASCGTPVFPHATACHTCDTPLAAPRDVGVFGQPREAAAADLALHRFNLVARKRCPRCATRLKERAVRQQCKACQTVTFASAADFERYLDALADRLPRTLLICLGLSAIPLLGVIPGVIYYRVTLVTGLRGYIPPLRGCVTKIAVRIINWGVIAFQPIPILGALIVPLMCFSTYWIYRRALAGRAEKDLATAVAALPSA